MIKHFFILFILCGLTSYAWACDSLGNNVTYIHLQAKLTFTSAQKKVGDVLYSRQSTLSELSGSNDTLACSDKVGILTVAGMLAGRELGKSVYQTSVPGIGIRIFYYSNQPSTEKTLKVFPFNNLSVLRKNTPLRPENIALKIELVKTGPIASVPALFFNQTALLRFTAAGHTSVVNFQIMASLPETVCNVDSQQTFVHLPAQSVESITERRPTARYPLPIKISCTGELHLLTVTLNGDTYNASQGIMNIEKTPDAAQGVGVQFWYRARPVRTNLPLLITTVGKNTLNNQITLPFFVSYVRTDKNITSGKISAGAILHINYL